ncbi:MAG: elongation factor 1-beta [Thermoprotei archaeon]
MGKVIVSMRVNPESDEVDLDKLVSDIRSRLPSYYEILRYEKEYVAFGLYALRLYIAMPEDFEGGTDELERSLTEVEGVSSIDIDFVTRTDAL